MTTDFIPTESMEFGDLFFSSKVGWLCEKVGMGTFMVHADEYAERPYSDPHFKPSYGYLVGKVKPNLAQPPSLDNPVKKHPIRPNFFA